MAKKASKERIKQFRKDLRLLKQKYSNKQIAVRAKIGAANLSSYCTGAKNPGEKTINDFYKEFENEIKNMDYQHPSEDDPQQPAENPALIKYLHANETRKDHSYDDRDDHIQTLKKNNDALLAGITKVIDNNTIAVKSTKTAIKTTADAVKGTNKMVDLIVLKFGPPN